MRDRCGCAAHTRENVGKHSIAVAASIGNIMHVWPCYAKVRARSRPRTTSSIRWMLVSQKARLASGSPARRRWTRPCFAYRLTDVPIPHRPRVMMLANSRWRWRRSWLAPEWRIWYSTLSSGSPKRWTAFSKQRRTSSLVELKIRPDAPFARKRYEQLAHPFKVYLVEQDGVVPRECLSRCEKFSRG